ncbi:MAG: DUF2933 domain-containing protein [Deltaproteobacteria bacterium]|nr:DUF2933 domain-containing protein [Deltaproteobacteria bacterium]
METGDKSAIGSWLKSRAGWVLLGFLAIMGFFLITEHGAHLFGVLPFLLLYHQTIMEKGIIRWMSSICSDEP